MVTLDDIANLIEAQLIATSGYAAALPGGAIYDRGSDTPNGYPYAVYGIKASPAELIFEDAYSQKFQVSIASYCPPTVVTGISTSTVQQFFWTALAIEAANNTLVATALRNPTEHVLHAIPQPETGAFAPQLREGRDVFVCGLSVEILVQGDRSVS